MEHPPDGYQHGHNSTNSGKTATPHSLLSHINTPERKIWTTENPIEISQDGLSRRKCSKHDSWRRLASRGISTGSG